MPLFNTAVYADCRLEYVFEAENEEQARAMVGTVDEPCDDWRADAVLVDTEIVDNEEPCDNTVDGTIALDPVGDDDSIARIYHADKNWKATQEAIAFVELVARMNWDGEEMLDDDGNETGQQHDISNDDTHDTMVSLITQARGIIERKKAGE